MIHRKTASWMWGEALDVLREAERLHRQFFRAPAAGSRPAWEPPVDLIESDHELILAVALPGVAPEQVRVLEEPGALVVTACRQLRVPARSGGVAIHRLEIPYGRFERRIALPPGHYELVEQGLHHGCLVLRLRKLTARTS